MICRLFPFSRGDVGRGSGEDILLPAPSGPLIWAENPPGLVERPSPFGHGARARHCGQDMRGVGASREAGSAETGGFVRIRLLSTLCAFHLRGRECALQSRAGIVYPTTGNRRSGISYHPSATPKSARPSSYKTSMLPRYNFDGW